jgi:hypothetical protein
MLVGSANSEEFLSVLTCNSASTLPPEMFSVLCPGRIATKTRTVLLAVNSSAAARSEQASGLNMITTCP